MRPGDAGTVLYLALCDAPPAYALLASHAAPGASDCESVLRTLFASPGWATSMLAEGRTRLELKSGSRLFCIEVDRGAEGEGIARVYCAVVSEAYPTRFVFSAGGAGGGGGGGGGGAPPRAMTEFRALVARALPPTDGRAAGAEARARAEAKALRAALRGALKPLAERFSALEGLDKVAAVQRKLEGLRGALVDNLVRATERDSLLEDLEVKTSRLREGAATMERSAQGYKRRACAQYYKSVLACTLLALLVLGGIAAGVTKSQGLWR